MKGQKARSGGGVSPHFEGGQLQFMRRMAYKRGFRNPFRVEYEHVNVGQLGRLSAGATVNAETLKALRLVQSDRPLKILGDGELSIALTVEADSFSASAKEKIVAAGGSVTWINGEPEPEEPKEAPAPKKRAAKSEAPEPTVEASGAAPKKRAAKAEPKKGSADAEAPAEGEADDGSGS